MHWIRKKKEENAHLYKEMLLIQGGLESLTITASFIFKAKKSPCFFTLNDLRASNQKITTLFSVMTSVGHAGHGIALLFDNLFAFMGWMIFYILKIFFSCDFFQFFQWNLQNFFINQLGNHSSSQQLAYCTIMDGYLKKGFLKILKMQLHIQVVKCAFALV